MPLKDIIQYQTVSADPIVVGDTRVTPQTQTLTVRLPFGGLVWNRPVAVLVERDDGTQRIPIRNMTRVTQIVLFGLILSFSVIITLVAAQRARPRS
jgi:hypothetical protein